LKFRLHPVLLPLFVFLAIMDGLAAYATVFLSLLVHEAGHIFAALVFGMRVRSVTIYPYGGELIIPRKEEHPKPAQFLLALGGPAATALLLAAAWAVPFPGAEDVIRVQLVILLVNLLPVLPLDGGQALLVLLESESSRHADHTAFILFSIAFLLTAFGLLVTGLPETMLLAALSVFLCFQNISVFRYRRYRRVYDRLKRNRLT